GFEETVVASGFIQPTALVVVRPTLLLVAEKSGSVWIVKDGRVRPAPLLTIDVAVESERGLNEIALEPGFRGNGYLYADYTRPTTPRVNRLSRFYLSPHHVGAEEVLVDDIASDSGNHNSGCIRFAADGTLLFSAGDGGKHSEYAEDLSNLS